MTNPQRVTRLPAEARRKLIIEAAIQLFGNANYHMTTTVAVAQAAQISQANVFKYFPTKQDLYLAALDTIVQRIIKRWDLAIVDVADPFQAFIALNQMQLAMTINPHYRPEFRLLYLAAAETNEPEITQRLREHYQTLAAYLTQLITRAKKAGQLRPKIDPHAASWQVIGLFQHQLLHWLINNEDVFIKGQSTFVPMYLRMVGFREGLIKRYEVDRKRERE